MSKIKQSQQAEDKEALKFVIRFHQERISSFMEQSEVLRSESVAISQEMQEIKSSEYFDPENARAINNLISPLAECEGFCIETTSHLKRIKQVLEKIQKQLSEEGEPITDTIKSTKSVKNVERDLSIIPNLFEPYRNKVECTSRLLDFIKKRLERIRSLCSIEMYITKCTEVRQMIGSLRQSFGLEASDRNTRLEMELIMAEMQVNIIEHAVDTNFSPNLFNRAKIVKEFDIFEKVQKQLDNIEDSRKENSDSVSGWDRSLKSIGINPVAQSRINLRIERLKLMRTEMMIQDKKI